MRIRVRDISCRHARAAGEEVPAKGNGHLRARTLSFCVVWTVTLSSTASFMTRAVDHGRARTVVDYVPLYRTSEHLLHSCLVLSISRLHYGGHEALLLLCTFAFPPLPPPPFLL